MALAKQAKVLSDGQLKTLLTYCQTTRHPVRNTVVVLLSFKAGLRAAEIANLRWKHCLEGGGIAESLTITNDIAKGSTGGRCVPMHRDLRVALADLFMMSEQRDWLDPVITTERCRKGVAAQTITNWFHATYKTLGFSGCSSHSGRRTFITKAAKSCSLVGGSLKDVQELAGHSDLKTTARYINACENAQKELIRRL